MSTNFDWHPGDGEVVHIGKRSGAGGGLVGWSFQGYLWADTSIRSWARWKACLRVTGIVVDEYGTQHDVEDFIAEVERTTPENRRRQFDMVVAEGGERDSDWICPDGFSFTWNDFS